MKAPEDYTSLLAEFQKRLPLLNEITVLFDNLNLPAERVPWFFGFFLTATEKQEPGACCFVLDKRPETTAMVSVLAALIRFQRDFPGLVRLHAENNFSRGDRVRVKPNNFVYEYEGIFEAGLLWLKVLGSRADRRSFPLEDVLRLESTHLSRPKGRLNSRLGDFEISPLGALLGLQECGNKNLIQNKTLVLMEQTKFDRFANSTILAPSHISAEEFEKLSSLLSSGSIALDGALRSKDGHEPMIAVTSTPQYLSSACLNAEPASKMVFVDGAKKITQNLQAFDDIAERQKMVILASPDEREFIDELRDRNCSVWKMSPEEIFIGETSAVARERRSVVGATIRATDIRCRAKVVTVDCEDSLLQHAAVHLDHATKMIRKGERDSEAEEIAGYLVRILVDFSECCFGVGDSTMSELAETENRFKGHEKYLEEGIRIGIQQAIDGLKQVVEDGFRQNKADILQDILSRCSGKWIVMPRSSRTTECIREKLGTCSGFEVLRFAEIDSESEYDGVIVPAWPNKRNFEKLIMRALAPDIRVLTYPFEKKRVLFYKKNEERRSRSDHIDAAKQSSILGIKPDCFPETLSEKIAEEETPRREMKTEKFDFFDLEDGKEKYRSLSSTETLDHKDVCEAQAVYFFGEWYALLTTEWVRQYVLRKNDEGEFKQLSKTSLQVSAGDLVLFISGGDKEIARTVAERILGEEKYRKTRETAELWKQPLRGLGDSLGAIQTELAKYGLNRSLPTIQNWMKNPDLVGPREYNDLEIIMNASGDKELASRVDEVRKSVEIIRRVHKSAGRKRSKLILSRLGSDRFEEIDEQPDLPIRRDFGYGKVLVVRVKSIGPTLMYDAKDVNRLLLD